MILILGSGESGVGSALLAKSKGLDVLISDSGTIKKVFKNILLKNNIDFEENGHQRALSLNFNLVVKSPGISDSNPVVINLIKKNIPVISEIEFAFGFTNSNIIGITGSNGKTTVSSLIFDILKRSEMDVDLVGNIGKSFASSVSFSPDRKNFVIEISSFQLDGIKKFNPHIAVLLNLSADHLDRYNNNYDNYINSKFRIVMNQTSSDYFIYDNDDKEIIKFINNNSKKIKSIHLPFSLSSNNETVTHIENKNIISIINKKKIIMPINKNTSIYKKNRIKRIFEYADVIFIEISCLLHERGGLHCCSMNI